MKCNIKNPDIVDFAILIPLSYLSVASFLTSPSAWYERRASMWILFIIIYVICRIFHNHANFVKVVNLITTILAFALSGWGLLSFGFHAMDIYSAGFDDLYNFRHLFHPFGILNNAWAEVLILLIPATSYMPRKARFLAFIMITAGIILTFSKGAYIALTFIVTVAYFIKVRKGENTAALKLASVCGLTIIILLLVFFPSFLQWFTALSEFHSGSNEWRLAAIEKLSHNLSNISTFGYGIGQYCEFGIISGLPDYVWHPISVMPNILNRWLIEYGYIGTAVCILSISVVVYDLYKCNNYLLLSIIIALLIKNMTASYMSWPPFIPIFLAIYLGMTKHRGTATSRFLQVVFIICIFTPFLFLSISMIDSQLIKRDDSNSDLSCKRTQLDATSYAMRHYLEILSSKEYMDHRNDTLQKYESQYEDYLKHDYFYPIFKKSAHFPSSSVMIRNVDLLEGNYYWKFISGNESLSQGNKPMGFKYLLDAYIQNPALLSTYESHNIFDQYPELRTYIIKAVNSRLKMSDSAKQLARYGAILHHCGYQSADSILTLALKKSPSLVIPWLLVGKNLQYNFLKYGIQDNRLIDNRKTLSLFNLMLDDYRNFYYHRYGKQLQVHY